MENGKIISVKKVKNTGNTSVNMKDNISTSTVSSIVKSFEKCLEKPLEEIRKHNSIKIRSLEKIEEKKTLEYKKLKDIEERTLLEFKKLKEINERKKKESEILQKIEKEKYLELDNLKKIEEKKHLEFKNLQEISEKKKLENQKLDTEKKIKLEEIKKKNNMLTRIENIEKQKKSNKEITNEIRKEFQKEMIIKTLRERFDPTKIKDNTMKQYTSVTKISNDIKNEIKNKTKKSKIKKLDVNKEQITLDYLNYIAHDNIKETNYEIIHKPEDKLKTSPIEQEENAIYGEDIAKWLRDISLNNTSVLVEKKYIAILDETNREIPNTLKVMERGIFESYENAFKNALCYMTKGMNIDKYTGTGFQIRTVFIMSYKMVQMMQIPMI